MKKHNLLKVILSVLLLVVIATWFLPVTIVNSTGDGFTTQESMKIGLFHLASYIGVILQVFAPILVYILSIGGLYGVLFKIPQYRVLLDKIADGFKGKEWLFMVAVGVVFSLLTSMAGFSVVILFLFPFVTSVILLMGYDKMTAAILMVGSVIAGLIGTVFSENIVLGIYNILNSTLYNQGEEIIEFAKTDVLWKIALLVVSLSLVLVNTIIYANKHKGNVDLDKSRLVPKKVKSNGKVYPLVIVLDALLIVLALGFISWDLLGVNLFNDITNSFIKPTGSVFIKGFYGALNTVLGVSIDSNTGINNAFGNWGFNWMIGYEAPLMVFLTSGLLAFIYKVRFNEFVNSVGEGVKRALRPALLTVIAYMILVCTMYVQFEFTILQHIIDLNGFNLIVMCIVAIVVSALTVEAYFGPVSAESYITTSAILQGNAAIIALVWQSMYGLTMLIAPTSVILLVTLSYLDLTYTSWLKAIWKLFLELLAAILIILFIFNML